jgi:uncharacterized membrane protein YdcZ (DUF606 family)
MHSSRPITRSAVAARIPRSETIGLAVTGLAIAAMAIDHLLEGGGGFDADPAGFLVASGLSLALAWYLFGRVVPRAAADAVPEVRAARDALRCAIVTVLSLPAMWLGVPFVLAGAGIALGLFGRRGEDRRRAVAAIVIGALVLLAGTADYVEQAITKLT